MHALPFVMTQPNFVALIIVSSPNNNVNYYASTKLQIFM